MKFIYVLEDDERSQRDLLLTLKEIDSQLHIRFFLNLAEFHEWLKVAAHGGPLSLAKGGFKHASDTLPDVEPAANHELRLVLAKNEFLGTQNMGLIRRAQEFFLRKKICTPEQPTALILLAFDNPNFDIKLAEDRIVNNVLFKPYDKLILKLHLEYALTGRHPVKTDTVATMQISSKLEMLKDANFKGLRETGFSTVNNHEISLGAIRKYYSEAFKTDERKSVYASCSSCTKISESEFLCEFDFYGADSKQIANLRRLVQTNTSHTKKVLAGAGPAMPATATAAAGKVLNVIVLNEEATGAENFKGYLMERFSGCQYFTYSSYGQLLSDLQDKETPNRQQLPPQFDFVFATLGFFENEATRRWEQLDKSFVDRLAKSSLSAELKPVVYLFPLNKITPEEVLEFSAWSRDLFFHPLDRSYFIKKIVSQNKNLHPKEEVILHELADESLLKVANPVEITQISEAGLVMKYHRDMSIGSFREFILWRPKELENPEIIGTVHYSEQDKSTPGVFLNHFVFFGMTDHYLKHIRLWLLDAYIHTKEKE